MKSNLFILASALLITFILASCASSQKTENQSTETPQPPAKKDSIYVFDSAAPAKPEVKTDRSAQSLDESSHIMMTFYLVQIGAFTTKNRADEFAASSRDKISEPIEVTFNPDINLYVVQIERHFTSHEDAEAMRNQLWQKNEFKDAWIVTVQK